MQTVSPYKIGRNKHENPSYNVALFNERYSSCIFHLIKNKQKSLGCILGFCNLQLLDSCFALSLSCTTARKLQNFFTKPTIEFKLFLSRLSHILFLVVFKKNKNSVTFFSKTER